MPVFKGTIQLGEGDTEGLESSLAVDSGRLVVTAHTHEIGDWAVEDLSVQRRDGVFHIKVEGEELVVAAADPAGLSEVLGVEDQQPKRRLTRKPRAGKQSARKESTQQEPVPQGTTPVSTAPAAAASPVPAIGDEQSAGQKPSLWDRLPLHWKLAGFGVIGLVALGVFLPVLLALLLMLAGTATLFLAVAAKGETGITVLPPPFFATNAAIAAGITMLLLAVIVMVAA